MSPEAIRRQNELHEQRLEAWNINLASDAAAIVFKGCLTGLTHYAYDKLKSDIRLGDRLEVRAHPENLYDENATGIYKGGEQIAWIPKALNRIAAKARKQGRHMEAVVEYHRPDAMNPSNRLGVVIRAYHPLVKPAPEKLWDNATKLTTQEHKPMNKIDNLVAQNISLGTSAAFLEAGRIANNQITQIASKKLPIMVRAYADTALGRLLLANIAIMARDHFRPNDERLGKLVNAMAVSAYQEVLQQFDVEQMIEDMVSNNTIKRALNSIDKAEEAAPARAKKGD